MLKSSFPKVPSQLDVYSYCSLFLALVLLSDAVYYRVGYLFLPRLFILNSSEFCP